MTKFCPMNGWIFRVNDENISVNDINFGKNKKLWDLTIKWKFENLWLNDSTIKLLRNNGKLDQMEFNSCCQFSVKTTLSSSLDLYSLRTCTKFYI